MRKGPPAARRTVAILAIAGIALLAAACGGSSGASNPGSTTSRSPTSQLLAFSRCMRSHGVSTFPDPQAGAGNAKFPGAQQLGVSSSRYRTAENACQHLLPAGTADQFPPAEVPVLLIGMREFSQCMRSHRVPNWPDPSIDSQGRPVFAISISKLGFDPYSPRVWAKGNACSHLMPALPGLPAAVSP